MNLHPVIHTLPEQQQIDLLTYYANNIIGEGKQMPNKVFKSGQISQDEFIFHKLEDHMLGSDRVIDCYLDIIEKGIQHCINQKAPAMDPMASLGIAQYQGWYEKDLATIAACPRLSPEHIKRVGCLLGYLVDLVPIEATSAAMYGDCFSALAVNPIVNANTLKPQLEMLINRAQQQQAFLQGRDSECFLAAQVLRRVIGDICSKRSDDAEIISLLEHLGRQGKTYLTNVAKPALVVLNVFDLMGSAGNKIKMAYKPDDQVTSEQLVSAVKTFNYHHGDPRMAEFIVNNDRASTDDASHYFFDFLRLFNDAAIRLKQINAGANNGSGIEVYKELMRRSGRFLIDLMASGSISKEHIQSAAQTILKTKGTSKDADAGLGLYSLIGMVDWIKKRGFLDSQFIIDSIESLQINKNHYCLLQENPSISISEINCVVSDVYSRFISGVESKNIPVMPAFYQYRPFLLATVPMLLTAKYYPALLADKPMDVNGVVHAFEMGIYFSLFDEVDIKVMARAGMNDIYKAVKPNITKKIEENTAIHELVTGLLLQERLDQAESSPTLVNRKRPSF